MKKNQHRNLINNSAGFTLIEVMVAITLLVLVVIPLASLYAASLGVIQKSALYSQALQLCRARVEMCESLDYNALRYYDPVFTPGFRYNEQINDNRDWDTNDNYDVVNYDPTDLNDDEYDIPIYRDYYDNRTGRLIDPNYNGLCDDDLDGDGLFGVIDGDEDDIAIANPNGESWLSLDDMGNSTGRSVNLSDLPFHMQQFAINYSASGNVEYLLQKAGDGLYDTVVEGIYANSFDPYCYGTRGVLRNNGSREVISPIVDFSLQWNREDPLNSPYVNVGDLEHRYQTFRTFARMTTIIDPTPTLANPHIPDLYAYADGWSVIQRQAEDGWTDGQALKFSLCAERDLPLSYSLDSRSVGIARQGFDDPENFDDSYVNPLGVNYTQQVFGKKVIVTVFFLSGEGSQDDLNGDGFPDGETFSTSNSVVMERIFYNDSIMNGLYTPTYRFDVDDWELDDPDRHETKIDITGDDDETDPCSFENDGLPYLDDDWPSNL